VKAKKIEVKEGSVCIPIYEFADGRFCVDTLVGKTRKRITRTSLDAAKIEARKLIAQIISGRKNEELLSIGEAEDYRLAKQKLAPYGISLLTAVEDWINHHQRSKQLITKTVPSVVEEFLTAKELEGVGKLHLVDRQSRLKRFARSFSGRIDRITTAEIELWLRENGRSRRTQSNYRNAILQLFRFARSKRYLTKNEPTVVEEIVVGGDSEAAIEIYSPSEMRLLLRHSPPRLIPFFALGAFAGLRSQEIMRLEWKDIRFEQGFIEVSAAKSKTASRRLVPLLPVLKDWLFTIRKTSGRVMEYRHNAGLIRARIQFCESGIKVGDDVIQFTWKPNALRHSFASYRIAEVKDAARVALEMGNSPSMLFRNYRELVTEQQALEWFSLTSAEISEQDPNLTVVAA
jgi:integrase